MSLAIVYTRAALGIEAPLITVEVHLSNGDIKKSCVLCDVCGNSLGIPSNKKPESTENDSPSTSD